MRPWATPAVAFAVVLVLAASIARAFSTGPLTSADEPAHLDYALQVWHGHLPVFADGLRYRFPFGAQPPVQWVAQHPPLYYVLLAPVVGPLVDAGHAVQAIIAGRLVNALFVGGLVVASAWAAYRCFPRASRLPSVVAIVVALTGVVVVQGGTIYNDSLYALLCALACGVAAAAIRSGVGPVLLGAGAVVAAAGMTTRLSFGLWLAALVVGFALARGVRFGAVDAGAARAGAAGARGVLVRAVVAVVPLVAAGLASGWFWLRNHAITGSFSGRPTAWAGHVPREKRGDAAVVADAEFWRGIFGAFRGALDPLGALPWTLLLAPMALAVVAAVVVPLVRRARWSRSSVPGSSRGVATLVPTVLVVAMLAVVCVLFVVAEVRYVAGGGGPIVRYVLTITVPVSLVVAAGLSAWGRAVSWVLVTAWAAAAVVPLRSLVVFGGDAMIPHSAFVATAGFAVAVVALVCALGAVVARDVLLARTERAEAQASRAASSAAR